mmetsp:Transcript_38056/g.69557  ORF Transcript_38056/g.69557 Transcript_38056/m.69557 type:complete len:237 (-) Transcript_38056:1409-2119(-)
MQQRLQAKRGLGEQGQQIPQQRAAPSLHSVPASLGRPLGGLRSCQPRGKLFSETPVHGAPNPSSRAGPKHAGYFLGLGAAGGVCLVCVSPSASRPRSCVGKWGALHAHPHPDSAGHFGVAPHGATRPLELRGHRHEGSVGVASLGVNVRRVDGGEGQYLHKLQCPPRHGKVVAPHERSAACHRVLQEGSTVDGQPSAELVVPAPHLHRTPEQHQPRAVQNVAELVGAAPRDFHGAV